MAQDSCTLDAWVVATDSKVFTAHAYIVGDRWRHDINNDHFGDLSSLGVIIDAPVGQWEAGTPLHYVLDWFAQRIISIESVTKRKYSFHTDSYVLGLGETVEVSGTVYGVWAAYSVIDKSYTDSFTADAIKGLVFTLDAHLRGYAELNVDAVIV
jgi:hypothetical protein